MPSAAADAAAGRARAGALGLLFASGAAGLGVEIVGVFVQWLPLHQLDRPTLQSSVQAFLAVHPRAGAVPAWTCACSCSRVP